MERQDLAESLVEGGALELLKPVPDFLLLLFGPYLDGVQPPFGDGSQCNHLSGVPLVPDLALLRDLALNFQQVIHDLPGFADHPHPGHCFPGPGTGQGVSLDAVLLASSSQDEGLYAFEGLRQCRNLHPRTRGPLKPAQTAPQLTKVWLGHVSPRIEPGVQTHRERGLAGGVQRLHYQG
ncbi:MAG TPA: hypothetical protein VEI97_07035 [bacterium]|nr:hypothetical protein [bacterium]